MANLSPLGILAYEKRISDFTHLTASYLLSSPSRKA